MDQRALFLLLLLASALLRQYVGRFERTARCIARSARPESVPRAMRLMWPEWMSALAWGAALAAAGAAVLGWRSLGWQGVALVAAWHLLLARAADFLSPLPGWRHCLEVADRALEAYPFPPFVADLRASLRLMRLACEHRASRAAAAERVGAATSAEPAR